MKTKIVNNNQINLVIDSLKKGECIAFKTDTIFGLSCIATDINACKKIVKIKNRENKPLIILLKDKNDLQKYVKNISKRVQKIIDKFWPGPLTIIFELNYPFCNEITCGKNTIAIRVPNHDLTQKLLKKVGAPLVSTSANLSGKPTLNSADKILAVFDEKLSYIINADSQEKDLSSTIITFENNNIKILREGTITKQQLESIN